jgi:hypothetical protein
MLDFYSNHPMPSLSERKNSLMDFAKTQLNLEITPELENKITSIVSATKEYSLSGYAAFGKNEEI